VGAGARTVPGGGRLTVIGSLEDLSFPDILQVVHVSKQSGTLVLSVPSGERRVRFRNGLVCGATLGARGAELEEVLLQRGLVDARALGAARARHAETGEPLSSALVALGAITQESIEQVVRRELQAILRSLVLLQDGEFRFEIEAGATTGQGGGLGLTQGLDPGAILDGVPAPAVRPPRRRLDTRPASRAAPRTALLAIERSLLRRLLHDELARAGLRVESCGSPAEALGLARALGDGPALVCDLLIPEEAGPGCRGGLQLARRLREALPRATVVVVGEPRGAEIEAAARASGAAAYVPLPDLAETGGAEIASRLRLFAASVARALVDPALPAPPSGGPDAVRAVDALSLLRALIGEMRVETQAEIPLLVLRLAAEYFERGVLFAVQDGRACGTGAFEAAPSAGEERRLDERLRGVTLPLQRGSILQRAVQDRETYVGPIAPTRPNTGLLRSLGAPPPTEAALLPLSSDRHVYGILYGDNARSGRPVGDLKALEIFLSQAGMVLENAFLQRRLASFADTGSAGAPGGRGAAPDA
jgi:CheY-like chemotaxis protein